MRFPTSDTRVSSPYGWRVHPITGKRTLHAGADFPWGSTLYAVAAFTVTAAGYSVTGGWYVFLRLHDGNSAHYYHMAAASSWKIGTSGPEGATVGVMGNTGTSTTGKHLHFEMRRADGSSFDPVPYLTAGAAAGGGASPFPTPTPTPEQEAPDMALRIITSPYYRAAGQQVLHNGLTARSIGAAEALDLRQAGVPWHDYNDEHKFNNEINQVYLLAGQVNEATAKDILDEFGDRIDR